MACSTPGFPVLHHLVELAQARIHCMSDAIQTFHPLSPSSPSTFHLSQHQGLFQQIQLDLRIKWIEIKTIGPRLWASRAQQRSVSKGSRHENLWEKENKRGWVEKEHLAEMGKTVEQLSLQLSTPSTHHRTQSLGLRLDNQYPYFTKKPTANFLFIEFWSPN